MKQVDTIFIRVFGDLRRTPSPSGAGRSLRLETREKLAYYRESGRSRSNEVGYLRTIIWVLVAIILVVFAMANWNPVTVRVWPGQNLETKLPMLIFIAFLLGSLPMWRSEEHTSELQSLMR